jgi:hypothetical protein
MIRNPAPPYLRSVIAVSVGLFFGAFITFGVEALGHLVVPPPEGFDPKDPISVAATMAQMPTSAFLLLLLAYLVGPTSGAWIAARLAPSRSFRHAAVVGLFFLVGGVANFWNIPHPVWFVIAATLVFAAAPFLGTRLAGRA